MKANRAMVLVAAFSLLLLGREALAASETDAQLLTPDQKVWGLMQVWAETKFNFAYFDRVPELDWDEAVQAAIPRVLASADRSEYYRILRELAARLNDGHSLVLPPDALTGENDNPQIELHMVEGQAVVTRVGDTRENREAGLRPGLALVAVNGVPVWEYFEDHVARFYQGGTEQWTKALGLYLMLNGAKGSTVQLELRDPDGRAVNGKLTRDSRNADGSTFIHWLLGHQASLEHRMLDGDLAYFRLPSFGSEEIVRAFGEVLQALELDRIRGVILDVRVNNGGNSEHAYAIISRLIDQEIQTSRWRTRQYRPAQRSWGEPETWYEAPAVVVIWFLSR